MGNLTDSERPVPPRPLCETMPRAVATAIAHGKGINEMNLGRWADTYRCGVEDIRAAWDAELSRVSQSPDNPFDCEGK